MLTVYFDGYCNLCNGFVDFLIRRDHQRRLRYASLQGTTAAERLPSTLRDDLATMVVQDEHGHIMTESAAAIRALIELGGFFSLSRLFLLVPRFVRDWVYRAVARNRYRLAGKRSTCRLPSDEERSLFLP